MQTVEKWVTTHHSVVELSWKRFGAVLPLSFDTIVKGGDEKVSEWLKKDYERLKDKFAKVNGKSESGVQIFWDPKIIGQQIAEESDEINKFRGEMKSKSNGMVYFYQRKIEEALKKEVEKKADEYFKQFYSTIKEFADDICIEKAKRRDGEQMLMNLSLLMPDTRTKPLEEELSKIERIEGIKVHLTGPWPPYSFV